MVTDGLLGKSLCATGCGVGGLPAGAGDGHRERAGEAGPWVAGCGAQVVATAQPPPARLFKHNDLDKDVPQLRWSLLACTIGEAPSAACLLRTSPMHAASR
jgi:hypothetical protein